MQPDCNYTANAGQYHPVAACFAGKSGHCHNLMPAGPTLASEIEFNVKKCDLSIEIGAKS